MNKEFSWFTETPLRRVLGVFVVIASAALLLSLAGCEINANKDEKSGNKDVEIKTPFGDMSVKNKADAKDTGLPVYPGAVVKQDEHGNDKEKASVSMSMFGMKLSVVAFTSDDSPEKVLAWYREQMKPMGAFIECSGSGDIGNVGGHYDTKDKDSDEKLDMAVSCDKDSGNHGRKVTQLKMGTNGNQRIVAIGERKDGKPGTEFALVRLILGKRAETL